MVQQQLIEPKSEMGWMTWLTDEVLDEQRDFVDFEDLWDSVAAIVLQVLLLMGFNSVRKVGLRTFDGSMITVVKLMLENDAEEKS